MTRNQTYRRTIGALLVVGGAVLMWVAPGTPAGIVLLWAGFLLELTELT